MRDLKEDVLDLSRQAARPQLSPWFQMRFDHWITNGGFRAVPQLATDVDNLVHELELYRTTHGVSKVWLGMSGGVDSALTAHLFAKAGWQVTGMTLPIHQEPIETERGVEACEAAGIAHIGFDLSPMYDAMLEAQSASDPSILDDSKDARIRRGNIRARLRMITLYDRARSTGAVVASTDNFSELTAGFWTLHGDVGDISPLQGFLKSWEVPAMSREIGVPERTWRATPTDGLGIDAGDEAQIGCSYLEWDLMMHQILVHQDDLSRDPGDWMAKTFGEDGHAKRVFDLAYARLGGTWFKRKNPAFYAGPNHLRFRLLDEIDKGLLTRNGLEFI